MPWTREGNRIGFKSESHCIYVYIYINIYSDYLLIILPQTPKQVLWICWFFHCSTLLFPRQLACTVWQHSDIHRFCTGKQPCQKQSAWKGPIWSTTEPIVVRLQVWQPHILLQSIMFHPSSTVNKYSFKFWDAPISFIFLTRLWDSHPRFIDAWRRTSSWWYMDCLPTVTT